MTAKPRQRAGPGREIAWILVVKFMALFAIWAVWFSGPESRHADRERMDRAVYATPAAGPDGGDAHARP
jgi:hypothetical protein